MKTKQFLIAFALIVALVLSSCGGDSDGPTPTTPSISFAAGTDTQPVVIAGGGTVSIGFTATATWTAAVRDGSAWLSVSPASGEAGEATLLVTATANDSYDERNAVVVLTCGTVSKSITVTQKQKDALIVTTDKVELPAEGGGFSVELQANVDVTYEVEAAAQTWLSTVSTRGLQNRTLNFQASFNDSKEKRQARVTLKGANLTETVTVYQEGSVPLLVLTQDEYTVGSEGENIKVELKSNTTYEVKMPQVDWIKENNTRAISSYTHNFIISANETYDPRTAEIVFLNKEDEVADTVKVTQMQKDAIIVANSEYEVPAAGGILDFVLQANVEVEVTVSADWIQQRDARTRGLSERTLCFDILANEDTENGREGTITLKGAGGSVKQTIVVKQAKHQSVVIEGDKAIIKMGTDADVVKKTIADAAAAGCKDFTVTGDYEVLRLATDNPFMGITIGRLDLSGVTNWPVKDGLPEVPDNTFKNYKNIQEVILSTEVAVVGESAFKSCTGLKRIEAPGVRKVKYAAFQSCSKLEEVVLPEVTFMGRVSFSFTGLRKVDCPKLVTLEGNAFWFCSSLTEVNLPEAVTVGEATDGTASSRNGTSVFADNAKLEKVYLPKAVEIGDGAFSGCTALTEIDLPLAEKVGTTAFKGCKSVTVIRLPQVVQIMGNHNFTDCSSLTALYLTAAGDISMGTNCFGNSKLPGQICLTLNVNKKDQVTESYVGSGMEWKKYDWKSISFAGDE